jgi:membrane protein
VARRPLLIRIGWALRDYAKRVWDNSGEDNIFFLAGGIAFNILLAVVPFVLLLATGLAYFLDQSPATSSDEVIALLDRLLPVGPEGGSHIVHEVITEVTRSRGSVGWYSAIGFVWFSTRLFGSLRSVLADVFDVESDRGIIDGKLFDIKVTIVSTLLLVAYTATNAYLGIATTRGVALLRAYGLRQDVMGSLEYTIGRIIAFGFITLMFFGLYKVLPNRRIRWKTALVAALFSSGMFEIAKYLFTLYIQSFNPGSLYTGTVAAGVIVVFWVYYAAMIFILGGEVAQVYELRRVRRAQREVLEG